MNIFSLPALQRDRHVLYSCKSHVVLCPKDRRKVPVNGADKRLQEIIDPVAPALGSEVMERDVVPDHIHLLCEVAGCASACMSDLWYGHGLRPKCAINISRLGLESPGFDPRSPPSSGVGE